MLIASVIGLGRKLKEIGDSKRAVGEKKYLKSPWKFYGVSVPIRHKIVREWFKKHQLLQMDEAEKLAENLWNSVWHEEKSLAIEILQLVGYKLTTEQMPLVEKMINEVTSGIIWMKSPSSLSGR